MNENYLNIVKDIALKKVPLDNYAVFLFGSRAAGNAHPMSYIDVGSLDFNQVDSSFRKEALKKIIE